MQHKLGIILASTLLLGACQHDTQSLNDNISQHITETETQIEKLQVEEKALQEVFDQSLNDETEATDSTPLQDNIKSRQTIWEDLNQEATQLETEINDLKQALPTSDLSQEEKATYETTLKNSEAYYQSLASYLNSYQEVIDAENDFYQKLAEINADYETFHQGLTQVNEKYQAAQALLNELKEPLKAQQANAKGGEA